MVVLLVNFFNNNRLHILYCGTIMIATKSIDARASWLMLLFMLFGLNKVRVLDFTSCTVIPSMIATSSIDARASWLMLLLFGLNKVIRVFYFFFIHSIISFLDVRLAPPGKVSFFLMNPDYVLGVQK